MERLKNRQSTTLSGGQELEDRRPFQTPNKTVVLYHVFASCLSVGHSPGHLPTPDICPSLKRGVEHLPLPGKEEADICPSIKKEWGRDICLSLKQEGYIAVCYRRNLTKYKKRLTNHTILALNPKTQILAWLEFGLRPNTEVHKTAQTRTWLTFDSFIFFQHFKIIMKMLSAIILGRGKCPPTLFQGGANVPLSFQGGANVRGQMSGVGNVRSS